MTPVFDCWGMGIYNINPVLFYPSHLQFIVVLDIDTLDFFYTNTLCLMKWMRISSCFSEKCSGLDDDNSFVLWITSSQARVNLTHVCIVEPGILKKHYCFTRTNHSLFTHNKVLMFLLNHDDMSKKQFLQTHSSTPTTVFHSFVENTHNLD